MRVTSSLPAFDPDTCTAADVKSVSFGQRGSTRPCVYPRYLPRARFYESLLVPHVLDVNQCLGDGRM
jgi:hypothetical protein